MIAKIFIFVILSSSIGFAQRLIPSDYQKYVGYYVFIFDSTDDYDQFEDFIQLEISIIKTASGKSQLSGKIRFVTDSLDTTMEQECYTSLVKLFISKDSLFFRSQRCRGFSYQFGGRFLGVPSESQGDKAVLAGTLMCMKYGKVIRRAMVRFIWGEGCIHDDRRSKQMRKPTSANTL